MNQPEKIEKYIPLFERLLSLLIVFLLLAGSVVWSGKLFGRYIGGASGNDATLASAAAQPEARILNDLGLQEATLTPCDSVAWNVEDKDGKELGLVVSTEPYAKDVTGFAGNTPLYLWISADNHIKAIAADDNEESADFFKRAFEGVCAQLVGKDLDFVKAKPVDAVTGATFSSNAVISNVKYTLSARAKAADKVSKSPVIGWGRTVAVVVILALGIYAAYCCRGNRMVRLVVLALNVCVTGFWCGQFLSLSLLRGWIQNGLDPLLYLPALLMLLVAIVLPFVRRPHHYCTWVCPYGSLQELAYLLPVPKIHVSRGVFKLMRVVRLSVFMLLMLSLWMGFGASVLDYEPFTAFLFDVATPGVIVLAVVFVVLSVFIPHPWCRCLCPMGTLLELAEDAGGKKESKK